MMRRRCNYDDDPRAAALRLQASLKAPELPERCRPPLISRLITEISEFGGTVYSTCHFS